MTISAVERVLAMNLVHDLHQPSPREAVDVDLVHLVTKREAEARASLSNGHPVHKAMPGSAGCQPS